MPWKEAQFIEKKEMRDYLFLNRNHCGHVFFFMNLYNGLDQS